MKFILFTAFFLFSSVVLSCERKVPVNAEATLMHDTETIKIIIKAPKKHENYRLSGALYHQGKNYIPMKDYEESELISYQLRGTKDFFKNAVIDITYLAVDALCAHSERINLDSVIQNCNACNSDT